MSGSHFHVHGPHDHEIEHAAAHGDKDPFAGRVAVTTAILATVGALFSYEGGATQAAATLYKNDAAIRKTEAADRWAFYQSKSGKQNLAELGMGLLGAQPQNEAVLAEIARLKAEAERYKGEKDGLKKEAEALDHESAEFDEKSAHELHTHHRWAQATTAIQVAIALSAIALLTRRNWLQMGVYAVGAGGVALGIAAAMHL
ncbi:DUF4337 domain-containing protein [Derxia gummosa]|uniref:DUF4337 domain-containing protein n=1 Tax=Derxia gummosa DSM 723 TaxID=1121388 RepID=A0A8B6X210_9BURK|nr:DUF4337 domain-containing protein [Derxia gummosa]